MCNKAIRVGDRVEWSSGQKARHTSCKSGSKPQSGGLADGRAPTDVRRNARPAHCGLCGKNLPAGTGHLYRCIEDAGCLEHDNGSGWHVSCIDMNECEARRREIYEQAVKAREEAQARHAERQQRLAAENVAFDERRTALTVGRVRVDDGRVPSDVEWVARTEAGISTRSLGVAPDGTVVESTNSGDDYRTDVWLLPEQADAFWEQRASQMNLTLEKAEAWLAKYAGCYGADTYKYVVRKAKS